MKGGCGIDNYVVYHLHSDLSNAVTNVDSVTKFQQYIERAKDCGMRAMAFSEHGSVMEWWHKKQAIEAAGMKYIHAVECYLTESLASKVRDNYHCVLIARNYDGFLELNRLVSASFNRNDNHFYYVPRISFDELFSTSKNILVTSACVGGVFGKGSPEAQTLFLNFLQQNKGRCFLEIGHHMDEKQKVYNNKMLSFHKLSGVPLIAGTDTHALNAAHEKGRSILQESKHIHFDGEDSWDLKFKSLDELLEAYRLQACVPEAVYREAIENTNRMADMIEPFTLDRGTKYPHIYDEPEKTFRQKVMSAMDSHPYVLKNHTREELMPVVEQELSVYEATKSVDFMLLQTYLREWEQKNGILCGPGRGSVSGSMVAYLLGITQMDSMRFGLNFFRFMNPSRVTNADIDTDYSGKDRDRVKEFLLRDKMDLPGIRTAEIITFNTIATKGAIRDVCRALYRNSEKFNYLELADKICKEAEANEDAARKKYPEVFQYVDLVSGTIVSVGTHPSGVLISDLPIEETIGLCSVSTSDYPVSMINMKELDDLMYVKLDILGLDNVGVINDTCKMLDIPRLTPDNVDLNDEAVWKSIRDDTTLIFQWESDMAQKYIRRFMSDETLKKARQRSKNFSLLKWVSFGNGLLRPACASFRDSVAKGEFYDNGFDALNEFLAPEAGRIAMQETIMRFLVLFCGYTDAESDTVRRAIAKKKGTETLLPEIERRFIAWSSQHYDISEDRCAEVIKPFLQIILDASAYGFSWNHSDAYTCIGYISGYLRYYYPLQFITAALNIFNDNAEKTAVITKYASKRGIRITPPKWGISRERYFYDEKSNTIAKDITSIKYMSEKLAQQMFDLAHSKHYTYFTDLLRDLFDQTCIDTRQLDMLTKIDFFSDFGNQRELLRLEDLFLGLFKKGEVKQIKRSSLEGTPLEPVVSKYAVGVTKTGGVAKSYTILDVGSILRETEDIIKAAGFEDLNDLVKVKNFEEIMGYAGYVSGKQEDRRKLFIMDLWPAVRRKDGHQYGYNVKTKSIGSGKEWQFTIRTTLYQKHPIQKGDVIYCSEYTSNDKYYYLTKYARIC